MKPAAVLFLLIPVMPLPAEPPAAAGDTYATAEDAALEVNAAAGVSANDAPGSAIAPAAGLVSAPLHGSVTLNPDGSFRYVPAADFFGPDTFSYRVFGDRTPTAFTIDPANSRLTIGATLRLTFQGVPSVSSDSTTSAVTGTMAAEVAPGTAPFSLVRVTGFDGVLRDPVRLKLGVGCLPIINTCLGGIQFDAPADALSLALTDAGPVTAVRPGGAFDADGAQFAFGGNGTITGTEQLAELLPATPLPLEFPPIPMPFNGRLTVAGSDVRLEMQINFRGTVAIDAATSLSFSISGIIRGHAPLPLAPVASSNPAQVNIRVRPVNDAPSAVGDSYLVRAGTFLDVAADGSVTTQPLIAAGSVWKYLHNGTDPGRSWKSWNFTDAAWPSGPAELGYGDAGLPENRPEATNIRPGAAHPTAWFRREFNVSGVNATRSISLELLRDDGAAVYLNGFEVARQNLAADAGPNTLALSRIPNADETRYFPVTVPPGLLLEGRNVIAVEVHQFSTTDFFSISPPVIDRADLSFNLRMSRERGLTGLLANDRDVDSSTLTATVAIPPARGLLDLKPDGSFSYTPDPGFSGTDSFVYRISDGSDALAALRLVPAGATWKYLDDGSDQGTAWIQPGFADASWPSGAAEIGYGDDNTLDDRPETTRLSYLLGTPPVTTYFRRTFTLPVPKSMIRSLRLRVLRDDGAAVYLNGVEIARDNLSAGAAFDAGATLPVEGSDEARYFEYSLPAEAFAALRDGSNVLAVELHQNLNVSNDASFDCELIAEAIPGARVILDVPAEDLDGDGLPDAWERQHGLDFANPNAAADEDSDTFPNAAEYAWGTHPANRSSHPRCDPAAAPEARLRLRIPSAIGRLYQLEGSDDLGTWQSEGPAAPGTGSELDLLTPAGSTRPFWRVRASLP
jgi:hypothetical protein